MYAITGPISGVGACCHLVYHILLLLSTAKSNKKECQSLLSAVRCIDGFLQRIPPESITPEGNAVLGELEEALLAARQLLVQVAATGPLMSLLTGPGVRSEFLRINRDLINTFHLLAAGEKLLDLTHGRMQQLQQIEKELGRCNSEFFVQQDAAGSRLRDVAAAAREAHWPEQLVQRRLLDQLHAVPEVEAMAPEELLTEFQALQMMALYNGPGGLTASSSSSLHGAARKAAEAAEAAAGPGKGKGAIDAEMEEWLVQQLCAALAASVAAGTPGVPLMPQAAAAPPEDFLCPISQTVMVQPVVLTETGHSFEEANIRRWLEAHSTCPVTRQQLQSKHLVLNYSLKKAIHDWAARAGVRLPAPPTFTPLLGDAPPSPAAATAAAAVAAATPAPAPAGASTSQLPGLFTAPGVARSSASSSRPAMMAAAAGKDVAAGGPQQSPFDEETGLMPGRAAYSSFAAAGGGAAAGAASGGGGLSTSSRHSPFELGGEFGPPDAGKRRRCRCTRTSWALSFLSVILLVAVGAAVGAGVYYSQASKSQQQAEPVPALVPASSTPSSPVHAVADTNPGSRHNITSDQAKGIGSDLQTGVAVLAPAPAPAMPSPDKTSPNSSVAEPPPVAPVPAPAPVTPIVGATNGTHQEAGAAQQPAANSLPASSPLVTSPSEATGASPVPESSPAAPTTPSGTASAGPMHAVAHAAANTTAAPDPAVAANTSSLAAPPPAQAPPPPPPPPPAVTPALGAAPPASLNASNTTQATGAPGSPAEPAASTAVAPASPSVAPASPPPVPSASASPAPDAVSSPAPAASPPPVPVAAPSLAPAPAQRSPPSPLPSPVNTTSGAPGSPPEPAAFPAVPPASPSSVPAQPSSPSPAPSPTNTTPIPAGAYLLLGSRSTPGNEIPCGQKDNNTGQPQAFCRICGGVLAVVDACDARPECRGYDLEGTTGCGYLKAAAGPKATTHTEGFSHFCRTGANDACGDPTGTYTLARNTDITAADLDMECAGGTDAKAPRPTFCEVTGSPSVVAAACSATTGCKAFTTVSNTSGYLKKGAEPRQDRAGAAVYIKNA